MRAVPLNRYLLFLVITVGGCLTDLATKTWVFGWLGMPAPGNQPWWIWKDFFGLQTSLNEGALFGMGQGKVPLFAALSIMAAAAVIIWLFYGEAIRDLCLASALSAILAGILGNLYDRLGMHGLRWDFLNPQHNVGDPVYAVRDWILVMIGRWHWPNFNIADSLLVGGATLLVVHAILKGDSPSKP